MLEVSSQSDLQRMIILFIEWDWMTYAQEKENLDWGDEGREVESLQYTLNISRDELHR